MCQRRRKSMWLVPVRPWTIRWKVPLRCRRKLRSGWLKRLTDWKGWRSLIKTSWTSCAIIVKKIGIYGWLRHMRVSIFLYADMARRLVKRHWRQRIVIGGNQDIMRWIHHCVEYWKEGIQDWQLRGYSRETQRAGQWRLQDGFDDAFGGTCKT